MKNFSDEIRVSRVEKSSSKKLTFVEAFYLMFIVDNGCQKNINRLYEFCKNIPPEKVSGGLDPRLRA